MKIILEDVIGWENSNGSILCDKCFIKKFKGHYPIEWEPIYDEGKEEILYECEEEGCDEPRFTN
ncbi:MAG: hypothetical protein ABSA74_00305 [Candidatus Staskawiczbacteria bacterium]|jgi:hypothetical protein